MKSFSFKSVDDVVEVMEEGDFISVVDIKSAYKAVSVDPEHADLQALRWEVNGKERYLIDKRLCFGLRCAPYYFYLISEFIYNVLSDRYGITVVNYLDDFAAISRSFDEGLFAQNCIIKLLRFLGFHVSWNKVTCPFQNATFLGIIIDTVNLELRLPEGKANKTLGLLNKVNGCKTISRKNFQQEARGKLTGLLAHCSCVVKGGRTYCRRLYNLHKVAIQKHLKVVRLSTEAQADINWWLQFICVFNGKSTVKKEKYMYDMTSDSSRLGFGVYLGKDWLYGSWEENCMFDSDCKHLCDIQPVLSEADGVNINVLELWPVVVGVKRWGHKVAGSTLMVVVDNMQVLYMLHTGRRKYGKDPY